MRRSTVIATVLAAACLPAAAASAARLQDPSAPGPHLTAAQLKAINGHQPPEPLPEYVVTSMPIERIETGAADDAGLPWALVALPLTLALGTGGAALFRRRPRPARAVEA